MAVTITIEDANEYLAAMGVTLPAIIVRAILGKGNSIDLCLEGAGYDDDTITLIKLYLIGLLGLVSPSRNISSQTAPNGASQSFRYGSLSDNYRSLIGQLRLLDTSGCTDALIPADPDKTYSAGLWVSPDVPECRD